jgi:hypothetical protein
MNSLIVCGKADFRFDEDKVFRDLEGILGVYNLERGDFVGAALQCEYEFNGDRTIVRLSDDLESITIAGTGDASLQVALELQRREEQPLFVTDFGYDFNFSLKGIHTIDAIKEKMRASEGVVVA